MKKNVLLAFPRRLTTITIVIALTRTVMIAYPFARLCLTLTKSTKIKSSEKAKIEILLFINKSLMVPNLSVESL